MMLSFKFNLWMKYYVVKVISYHEHNYILLASMAS